MKRLIDKLLNLSLGILGGMYGLYFLSYHIFEWSGEELVLFLPILIFMIIRLFLNKSMIPLVYALLVSIIVNLSIS